MPPAPAEILDENCISLTRFCTAPNAIYSTGNHADFHRLDIHALLYEPFDGRRHFAARAVEFEADDADFVRHAGLTDVCHELELVSDLVDERLLNQLRRI